jgi:ABC-2 type transport system ATP-binding protein
MVIHTLNLTKKFGEQTAVENLTFDIPRGKIFGFIGPSGSGKTTTLRMLTGILEPTSGEVSVLGRRPSKFAPRIREQIGYMPQLFALYPDLTVWENMNFAASLYGMGGFRGKQLRRALEFVELYDDRGKLTRNLSGGMQRRLSLAATLVHDPKLLFLDEPTTAIDPILRAKFWEHFKSLQRAGRTLFITTQYVSEAAHCDLIGVLAEGHLLMVDTPQGLRRHAFGGEVVELHTPERVDYSHVQLLQRLPYVRRISRTSDLDLRLIVEEASTAIPALLEWAKEQRINVESITEYLPPFDDVFVELVKHNGLSH